MKLKILLFLGCSFHTVIFSGAGKHSFVNRLPKQYGWPSYRESDGDGDDYSSSDSVEDNFSPETPKFTWRPNPTTTSRPSRTKPTPPPRNSTAPIIELIVQFKQLPASQSPDGVAKEIITINDQFPGPTLRAKLYDTVRIRLHNRLQDSNGTRHDTSMHFHGIEMKLEPWMDGPERVTQCPIPYGQYMDYEFTLHQSGTYWYHSHHKWQIVDGYWGFLIVDNRQDDQQQYSGGTLKDVHPYDDELHISLTDWHWNTGGQLTEVMTRNNDSVSPNANSALINGRGSANCTNATLSGFSCDERVSNGAMVFNVFKGLTYRLRLLNPGARGSFNFSIDGHKIRVIEVDGVDTTLGRPVDVVTLWPAQRYSVLVTMNSSSRNDNFWIRGDMIIDGNPVENARVTAVLHYLGQRSPPPGGCGRSATMGQGELKYFIRRLRSQMKKSVGGGKQGRPCEMKMPWEDEFIVGNSTGGQGQSRGQRGGGQGVKVLPAQDKGETYVIERRCLNQTVTTRRAQNPIILDQEWCDPVVVNEDGSHSVERSPQNVSQFITLNATIPGNNWLINGETYTVEQEPPPLPAIFQVMEGGPVSQNFRPQYVQLGQAVEIVINNQNPAAHPYHLHGHTYYVIGTGREGDGPFNSSNPEHMQRLRGPALRRDTTHTQPNSWTVVRIITNNPGVWILHCHIHWHFDRGLAAVFVEGEEAQRERYRIPDESRRVCAMSGVNIRTT